MDQHMPQQPSSQAPLSLRDQITRLRAQLDAFATTLQTQAPAHSTYVLSPEQSAAWDQDVRQASVISRQVDAELRAAHDGLPVDIVHPDGRVAEAAVSNPHQATLEAIESLKDRLEHLPTPDKSRTYGHPRAQGMGY